MDPNLLFFYQSFLLQSYEMVGFKLNVNKSELKPVKTFSFSVSSSDWIWGGLSSGYSITRLTIYPPGLACRFNSMGLTNRFAPPFRFHKLVLHPLLWQWQDISFLKSGVSIQPLQTDTIIYGRLDPGVGRPHGGSSDFRNLISFSPQAPHRLSKLSSRWYLWLCVTGLQCFRADKL